MQTRSGLVIKTMPVKRSGELIQVAANPQSADEMSNVETRRNDPNDKCMNFIPFVTRFNMIQSDTTCDVTTEAAWSDKDIQQFNKDRYSY